MAVGKKSGKEHRILSNKTFFGYLYEKFWAELLIIKKKCTAMYWVNFIVSYVNEIVLILIIVYSNQDILANI